MPYFDKECVNRGRKNTLKIIILFSILYSILFIGGISLSKEGISLYDIYGIGLVFFILFSVYRGSEKAYFYVQVQIFAWIGCVILMILFFIYEINTWLHELNYIILLIPCILGGLGVPMIFMMKSKFMGDIETYLAYKKR